VRFPVTCRPLACLGRDVNDSMTTASIFQLRGRIGRVRCLVYYLALSVALLLCCATIDAIIGYNEAGQHAVRLLGAAASVAVVVVGGRRLHDLGHTRWFTLGLLIPVLNIPIVLLLLGAPGNIGPNRFGPAPAPNSRGLLAVAWAVPVLIVAGVLAAVILAPHKSTFERARDEMEQAI
jgi:uncharacterized membrane protein YhaH (DUF805 family)